jgi:hypothetical protein
MTILIKVLSFYNSFLFNFHTLPGSSFIIASTNSTISSGVGSEGFTIFMIPEVPKVYSNTNDLKTCDPGRGRTSGIRFSFCVCMSKWIDCSTDQEIPHYVRNDNYLLLRRGEECGVRSAPHSSPLLIKDLSFRTKHSVVRNLHVLAIL